MLLRPKLLSYVLHIKIKLLTAQCLTPTLTHLSSKEGSSQQQCIAACRSCFVQNQNLNVLYLFLERKFLHLPTGDQYPVGARQHEKIVKVVDKPDILVFGCIGSNLYYVGSSIGNSNLNTTENFQIHTCRMLIRHNSRRVPTTFRLQTMTYDSILWVKKLFLALPTIEIA